MLTLATGTGVLAQTRVKVSGVITSAEDKLPIIGAAVMDSAGNGVITDLDGRYEIEAESSSELLFSCFGYLDVKKTVPDLPSCTINVEMETESLKLEDAVVIAYGVRKKGTVAGSVATVKAEKLENTPVPAFDQALQGQVAGVHQIPQALGEVKVADAVIAHGQIQHRVKRDGFDDPGGDIENEELDLQLVVDETAAFHKRYLQM